MNFKVLAVYVSWIVFCGLMHRTFGGFSMFSGFVEGCAAVGLASIFWTKEDVLRRRK